MRTIANIKNTDIQNTAADATATMVAGSGTP